MREHDPNATTEERYRNRFERNAHPPRRLVRDFLLLLSMVLCCAVFFAFVQTADDFAAVTFIPPWCWWSAGMGLLLLGFGWRRKVVMLLILVGWGAFAQFHVEETHSLWRLATAESRDAPEGDAGRRVRIVSFNTANSDAISAAEVVQFEPDIVLLQESPNRKTLDELATRLFGEDGSVIDGGDTSIIARGQLTTSSHEVKQKSVSGSLKLAGGRELHVVSLRLSPPVVRYDLWNRGCWKVQAAVRKEHRRDLRPLLEELEELPKDALIIVGGDFNAPARDPAIEKLAVRLVDTFRVAGYGWGSTATNDVPAVRIDQIWVSSSLEPQCVRAHHSKHSDHRIVVCDLLLPENP